MLDLSNSKIGRPTLPFGTLGPCEIGALANVFFGFAFVRAYVQSYPPKNYVFWLLKYVFTYLYFVS